MERKLNIIYHQGNANQNHNEISPHATEWLSSKRTQITNAGEDVEKRELWSLLVGTTMLLLLLLLSCFSRVRLCATPETAAHQAPPSLGFSGKNTGVGCHFLLQCMKVKSESEVAQLCPTLSDPMAPQSMGFFRQEY